MIKIFSMIIRSAIFLTILPFIVILLISFTEDTIISPYLKWWMIIIPAVPLWFLCFKSISINKDVRKGHIGKVNLNEIPKLLVLNDPKDNEAIRVAIVRQSGNEQRALIVFSIDDAIHEINKFFNRKQTDAVRIWTNTSKIFDVRIRYYHARGRKEGKVVSGVTLQMVKFSTSSLVKNKNTSINIDTKKNNAQKAIIKSFFELHENFDISPKTILDNFDPITCEGNKIRFDYMSIIKMLIVADVQLTGEAEFTDELRNQFKASDVGWQQEIGNDENLKSLKGIMAYSNTSPFEVQKEYIRLWKLCEQMVSNEQYDSSEEMKIFRLNHLDMMKNAKPKILDITF